MEDQGKSEAMGTVCHGFCTDPCAAAVLCCTRISTAVSHLNEVNAKHLGHTLHDLESEVAQGFQTALHSKGNFMMGVGAGVSYAFCFQRLNMPELYTVKPESWMF